MDVIKTAPALAPAAAWLAGLLFAFGLSSPPGLIWPALGLAAALAWSGRRGALSLGAGFAALLYGAAAGDGGRTTLDAVAGRPVELRGRALGHADGEGQRTFLLEARSLVVDERATAIDTEVLVVLGNVESPEQLAVDWGDELALRGLLLAPAAPKNGNPGWPGLFRLRVKSEKLVTPIGRGDPFDRLASALRHRAETAIAAWPDDPRAAGLLRCLLLGDRSRLPDSWQRTLNAVGLGHALSVSGFHISLVFGLCWALGSFLPWRWRSWRLLLAAGALVVYLLLVGPQPAALRAGLMGLAVVAALSLERPTLALNSLAVAAFLLTLERPQLVLDLGFELTLLATLGLFVGSALAPDGKPWRRLLAAGAGAELATLPILLPRTALWHPLSFACNLVAGPWLGLLIALGFVYLGMALWLPLLAPVAAGAFTLGCRPLFWIEALLPSAAFSLPVSEAGTIAWLLPAALLLALKGPRRGRGILLVAFLSCCQGGPPRANDRLEVAFLDVGQGDATLLIDGGAAILVDGGGWRRGDPAARLLVPALARLGVRELEAVVLSHDDLDHCGGLRALTAYWPAGSAWASAATAAEGCGAAVTGKAPRFVPLAAGDQMRFGRWRIEVLWPTGQAGEGASGNENSLVLRASAGEASLLLTGDIEKGAEAALLRAAPQALAATVLKVPHHGSRSSSTAPFLAAVGARWAVISVGEGNSFGHPAPEVEERLGRGGACRVLRTDRQGLIRFHWPDGRRPLRLELVGTPAPAYRMPK